MSNESHDSLQELRQQIDQIDTEILTLLNRRARVAQEVGHVKAKTNAPIFRPEREAQVLRTIAENNPGPLLDHDLQAIYREMMSACRALEKRIVIAYLGPEGTFSEQAVYKQFGRAVDGLPCASIDEVFRAVESGAAEFGVVPVENSTEGVVNRTLDLLLQTPLKMSGEIILPIHHNLMVKTDMQSVTKVCAHPQALAQCQQWLSAHYPNLSREAVSSNAMAAQMASEDETVAAIAGDLAAHKYLLKIIGSHIQDEPNNRTRFAVIGGLETAASGDDQTSLILSVPNKPGAVYQLLAPLAENGVSMTRFESRPSRIKNWEYNFYMDIQGHQDDPAVARALTTLIERSAFFKILGSYPVAIV